MILIYANGLGRQFAGDPVFQDLKFEVRAGERIGLVGPNGAGKTTLMRVLAGQDRADYGNLSVRPGIKVSLLRQEPDFASDRTLMEVAKSGLASLLDLRRELEEAAREMAEAEDEEDRAGPRVATVSCTTTWSIRTPTRSSTASRRSSPAWASARTTSTARHGRSRGASSRG